MGIARRKAGTVVRCPACAGQVVVPNPDEEKPAATGPAPLFERNDFEEIFRPSGRPTRPTPAPEAPVGATVPAGSVADSLEPAYDVEPVESTSATPVGTGTPLAPHPGVWLSRRLATWLSVAAILALALAFGAGLLVGCWLQRPAAATDTAPPVESQAPTPGRNIS
jgi:hypothetical protein